MATIILRLGKGSPLTNAELDGNFTNLNNDIATKASTSSLASVAFTGSYSSLTGTPTLGTAAAKDIPATGNASATQVVYGSDTRLSDARTPTAHNQAWSTITGTPTTLSGYGITDAYSSSNPAGYITGITSSNVTTALGFTPYNATNPNGYITTAGARAAISVTGSGSYDSATGVITVTGGVTSFNTRTGAIVLSSTDVTTALGFTPYNSTNPNSYITTAGARSAISVTGSGSYDSATGVITVTGGVTSVNSRTGAVTITSGDVTGALGYTPYNSSNPSGYITSSALSGYLTSSTAASTYLPLSGGTLTGVTLVKRNLGTNDYTNVGQHNLHLRLQRSSDVKTLELGVLDNGTGVIQANEAGVGYQTLALNPVNGSVTANGQTVLHAGNYTSYSPSLTGSGASGTWGINVTGTAGSETFSTVTSRGSSTGTQISVSTSVGGYMYRGTKAGGGYGDSTAVFGAVLDNSNGAASYLFDGYKGGSGGTRTFYVRADGAGYFADSINIAGNTALHAGNVGTYALPIGGGTLTGVTNLYAGSAGNSPALCFGSETGGSKKAIYLDTYWLVIQGHQNEGIKLRTTDPSGNTTDRFVVTTSGATINGSQALHAGNYNSYALPLSGGTMSGTLSFNQPVGLGFANGQYIKDNGGGGLVIYSGAVIDLNAASYTTATNSLRAPIFYDSNDTAYFINPNGVSQVGGNNFYFGSHGQIYDDGNFHIDGRGSPVWINSLSNETVNLNVQTSGYVVMGNSARSPIFYDSQDTGYYVDPAGGNAKISRDLYISGNAGGSYGNRLIVGNTTTSYTLEDTNVRPVIQVHGQYPVLSLNHTVTSNGSHGPTVQFTANGTGNQFVIGMNGTGTQLDIGTSSSSNWNPHNGIASYNGTTGWRMDTSGNTYSFVSDRAPIFYDYNDTGYYLDPNAGSVLYYANFLRATGGSDSNGIPSLKIAGLSNYASLELGVQSNYDGFLRSYGNNLHYYSGHWRTAGSVASEDHQHYWYTSRNGSADWSTWKMQLNPNAALLVTGSMYSPIFYDYNDTGYYTDPNGTSVQAAVTLRTGGLKMERNYAGNTIWFNGGTDTNHALWNSYNGQDPNSRGASGSGFDGIFWNTYAGIQIRGGPSGAYNLITAAYEGSNGSTNSHVVGLYGYAGLQLATANGYAYASNQFRAPIFYDSQDTGYYLDPNSTSLSLSCAGNGNFGWGGGADKGVGINSGSGSGEYGRIRYYEDGTNRQTIHFFSRAWQGGGLTNTSSGAINLDGVNGTTFGAWNNPDMWIDHSGVSQSRGSSRAPIFYDSENTGYYCNPNSTSNFVALALSSGSKLTLQDSNHYLKYVSGGFSGVTIDGPQLGGHQGGELVTNNGGDNWSMRWDRDGNTHSRISSRAPIFYDSNDTGYYTDPNSTSRMNSMLVGNGAYCDIRLTDDESPNGYKYIHCNSNLIGFLSGGGSWIFNVDNSGNSSNSGSAKSTIYYDYNDTAYYIDPAGYSQHYANGSVNGSAGVGLSIWSQGGAGAIMSYHRGGAYAINLGLDSDNVIRWGGWSAAANRLQMDMSGNLTMAGNVTAYSDERLKKDWASLPTDFIEHLAQVKSGTYTRIDSDERQAGVSAQGLQKFLPETVQTDASGTLSVNYGSAALVSAVELAKEVVDLRKRVAHLESLINKLIGD